MKERSILFKLLMILAGLVLLIGCSSGAEDGGSSDDPGASQTVASVSIGVSDSSVSTDNSDSVTVTVSVLNSGNAAVEGATVRFSTTTGALGASSATTDEDGTAEVTFHCGLVNQSNRTAIITATSNGISATIPVLIQGSAVTANQSDTTLLVNDESDSLEIVVTNSGGGAIYNTDVDITVDSSSSGTVTVTPDSGTTGVDGSLAVSVTGTSSGTVTLNIEAAGATGTCSYTIEGEGNLLQITAPSSSTTMATNGSLTVSVSDPDSGTVMLTTSLGTFNGSGSSVALDASSGTASATFTSSSSGTATIEAYNTNDPDVTDRVTVYVYAPSSEAAQISIQGSSTVVSPSTADQSYSVTITATVTNSAGVRVGDAPVAFALSNTTGGGERLSPTVALTGMGTNSTDILGDATTTFTSGSLSTSGSGVAITAYLLDNTSVSDSMSMVIGDTPGSVVLGLSTEISSVNSDTAYEIDVSVLVADSNGNPVNGAVVSLGLWPLYYYTGDVWYGSTTVVGPIANEDTNRNQILDSGEDINSDGELTPANSSSGSIPSSVTVDENGVGTFTWIYLKDYAGFVTAEITASTEVLGTETTSTVTKRLPASQDDVDDGVLPSSSPFE